MEIAATRSAQPAGRAALHIAVQRYLFGVLEFAVEFGLQLAHLVRVSSEVVDDGTGGVGRGIGSGDELCECFSGELHLAHGFPAVILGRLQLGQQVFALRTVLKTVVDTGKGDTVSFLTEVNLLENHGSLRR